MATTERSMKVGIVLPQVHRPPKGERPRGADVLTVARAAEDCGFDSVWIVDHFHWDPIADQAQYGVAFSDEHQGVKFGAWECGTLLGALAAVTERVEIGTLVMNTQFRNPGLIAKMAETVDELSNGRFILGLGAGDYRSEHEAFGYPWERRVGRFEEALQVIRPLLRGEQVTFDGEFYAFNDALIFPKGPRPDGPPLLIGTLHGGPRMRRLVVQYADYLNAWLSFHDGQVDNYRVAHEEIQRSCEKFGRDPATLKRLVTLGVAMEGVPLAVPSGQPFRGEPGAIAEQLLAYRELGITELSIWLDPKTVEGVEWLAGVLDYL
jgi:alkanesulfonate monooxygenase SsuD/methylene tetrahydromethanopterin reductase-like flavin-dependent oxidoreductase (luciferase family)